MKDSNQTYFLDANIFLRTANNENKQQHTECLMLLEKIKKSDNEFKFYTGNLVIAEVLWTLQSFYQIDKHQAIQILAGITNIKNLEIIDSYNIRTGLIVFENFNVKFADALIASIPAITQKKWTVISYDKDFDKIGVIRKEPSEVVKLLK